MTPRRNPSDSHRANGPRRGEASMTLRTTLPALGVIAPYAGVVEGNRP
ncbi:hypothetical protein QE416_002446 [Microbacterium sp. SORGH_AS 421]|nr:hypothetical protein [Microbacterium sp. SORGH_AS_0421]